jgi:hypothetical protein
MQHIYFDGVKGVGKSALAAGLAERLSVPKFSHHDYRDVFGPEIPQEVHAWMDMPIKGFLNTLGMTSVMDRSIVSTFLYNQRKLGWLRSQKIIESLRGSFDWYRQNSFFFYIGFHDLNAIQKRRSEMSLSQMMQDHWDFDRLYRECGFPQFVLFGDDPIEQSLDAVCEKLKEGRSANGISA